MVALWCGNSWKWSNIFGVPWHSYIDLKWFVVSGTTEAPTFLFIMKHCVGIHLCKIIFLFYLCLLQVLVVLQYKTLVLCFRICIPLLDDLKLLLIEMSRLEGMGAFALRYLYIRAWCSSSIHCDGVNGLLVLDSRKACSLGPPKSKPRWWWNKENIFSLTKSEMLKQTAQQPYLQRQTCMAKAAPRQKCKVKKKRALETLQAALAMA